jgi:hypothetical protein
MKRIAVFAVAFAFILAAGVVLWPTSQAQAQQGCKDFQAIVQAWLPSSTPLLPTDTWGGPIYGFLGGALFAGVVSGNDGNETWRSHMGTGKAGAYTICADYPACTNSFTYEVSTSVFPLPPGKGGLVPYYGNTAKISVGKGTFQGAFGNLNVAGPALAWPDTNSPIGMTGRWNPSISGKVCGIQ